jgi:membrane complex biogenesis BtpA family protein
LTGSLFAQRRRPALVGVVHLAPLPGAPRPGPGLDAVLARAAADARALRDGGADAVIVENLGDSPFAADTVEPVTVAAMTRAVLAVREAAPDLEVGVNVLRNDALAALGVAAATAASFVRVNVLSGAMVTDQGVVQGRAREVALLRARLGGTVRVAADVLVKHAAPLGPTRLDDAARDTFHRAGAHALVVSGTGTGRPTSPADAATVREAVPEAPLWIGSGITPDTAAALAPFTAAVVGTWLHAGGVLDAPLDAARVRAVREALDRLTR